MATLQVYEMATNTEETSVKKPTMVSELPDESNLVIINGTLSLIDGYNETVYCINDVLETLENHADKFSNDKLESSVLTAVYNFFDQLKDEYE